MSQVRQEIAIIIDGKQCYGLKGESILTIARNNGINIPTLCDLKKLSPTGACRMCVVEEENGNIIASCKSYVTKPINVQTNTERLQKYRNQIMSFLCINHPLECGVCDKSGECELQDKVLESKVAIQPFFALQKKNDFVHFHNKIYDESLCIVCERCARTCNEFVGNNVLSVLAGGFSSKIGVNFDAYCEDCDECVSVCPTGAMISDRFTYTSNAWELEKIPSHCLHCSMRCELSYEIKHNIDSKKEVYRIKNQAHIHQLCHAGRHNFMRHNPFNHLFETTMQTSSPQFLTMQSNKSSAFNLVYVLESVDSIRLGIQATNEEAMLANLLAQKAQKKLYCNQALQYKEFGDTLKSISKKPFTTIKTALQDVDVCINLGCYMFDEIPVLRSDLSKLAIKKGVKNVWIHTIAESRFNSDLEIKYEVGFELALSAFLLDMFWQSLENLFLKTHEDISQAHSSNVDCKDFVGKQTLQHIEVFLKQVKTWLENLDIGNLIAESNISETELERLKELCISSYSIITPRHERLQKQHKVVILVGQDFYLSDDYNAIAQILGIIDALPFVTILPLAYGNANGIKEICNLSYDNGEYERVLGIRSKGEFEISPLAFYHQALSHHNHNTSNQQADGIIQDLERSIIAESSNLTLSQLNNISSDDIGFGRHCPLLPLQFIEGSVIDLNFNLVKLSPSFVEDGFAGIQTAIEGNTSLGYMNPALDLLDISKEYLELDEEYLISLTQKLPFNSLAFDNLETTKPLSIPFANSSQEFFLIHSLDFDEGSGIFVYNAALSGNLSFYDSCNNEAYYTQFSQQSKKSVLRVSEQFCIATKLKHDMNIFLQIATEIIQVNVQVMPMLKGMVAVLLSDEVLDTHKYFDYKRVEVEL